MNEPVFEDLVLEECLTLLREAVVGRVACMVEGAPVILPVNYRLVETSAQTWVAFRTRAGNVIDQAEIQAAFEIDGVDTARHDGWSVLVRGTLHHVDPDAAEFRERFDPVSWAGDARDAWLIIEPFAITGRRLRGPDPEWPFSPDAYL